MRKIRPPEIANRTTETVTRPIFSFSSGAAENLNTTTSKRSSVERSVNSSPRVIVGSVEQPMVGPQRVEQRKIEQRKIEQSKIAVAQEFPETEIELTAADFAMDLPAGVGSASFDPMSPELAVSWSSAAPTICCINTYPNGITFSVHKNDLLQGGMESSVERSISKRGVKSAQPSESMVKVNDDEVEKGTKRKFSTQQFHLRFRDTRDYMIPDGKYFLFRERYLQSLESHLAQLHQQGVLADAVVYFGNVTDPFLNLQKKFDVTMSCLQLLERYTPAKVVCQTRSPMVISALPTFKYLGNRAVVAIPVETMLERSVVRYTPGMPKIAERLVAADGLRKQGICVNLVASPVLPYGDYERDAWDFADLLVRHSDYVTFGSLATGDESEERILRTMPVVQKLAADKEFLWLRPHSYRAVYQAARTLAPEKLSLPVQNAVRRGQLSLFAA